MRRCAKRDSHRGSERWERPSTDHHRTGSYKPRLPTARLGRQPPDAGDRGAPTGRRAMTMTVGPLSLSLSSRQGPGYPTYSRRCSLYPLVFVVGTLISRCRLLDDAVERCGLVLEAERLGVWIKVVAVEGEGDLGSAHFGEARSEDAQFRL